MTRKLALLVIAAALTLVTAVGTRPTAAQTCIPLICPVKSHLFCCPTYSFCCPDTAICACG